MVPGTLPYLAEVGLLDEMGLEGLDVRGEHGQRDDGRDHRRRWDHLLLLLL